MSEKTEPRKVRIGILPVLLVLAVLLGGGVWFALAQGGDSGTHTATATPEPGTSVSATPEPSASVTVPPVPDTRAYLTEQLGAGYALLDADDKPAAFCEASQFVAPYKPGASTLSSVARAPVKTSDGWVTLQPYHNDPDDGYKGFILPDCP